MSFRLPAPVEKLFSRMGSAARGIAQMADPAMDSLATALPVVQTAAFLEGTIVRTGPGWYDAEVQISGRGTVPCAILTSIASNLYGVSECVLPVEGTRVLVYLPSISSVKGTIVGILPAYDATPAVNKDRSKAAPGFSSFWEFESNGSVGSEAAYFKPLSDKETRTKVNANAARPLDVLPGMYVLQNEQGVGLGITPLATTIKANNRAQVRVSSVDDQVRIVAGYFQMFDAAGTLQVFNDGGYVTEERSLTSYQCERSGAKAIGTKIFEADTKNTLKERSLVSSLKKLKARLVPKKRLQMFSGFMGDLVNIFVANPDPTVELETEDNKSKDQGLAQVHMDANGRLLVRSASGITLQRWDRIPVPKRLRQPWDPAGDKVEDQGEPEPKRPFRFNEQHPYGRSLELRDAVAWRYRESYWHLYNQSISTGKRDFYLPEEGDMDVPKDEYDGPGKGTADFAKSDKRQATLSLEDDGSIIMRDAWGSEIILRGGNIIINCAGQIEMHSGKNTVLTAGHDAVIKARQSVDLTATERDVRIKADVNLHLLAEGRNRGGGILIESKAQGDAGTWKDQKGEDVQSKGVVIRAPNSTVFADGHVVHLSGSKEVKVETYSEDTDTNDGRISLSARVIQGSALQKIILCTPSDAGLLLQNDAAYLVGKSATLAGGTSVAVLKGTKYAVPLAFVNIGTNVFEDIQPVLDLTNEYLQTDKPAFLTAFDIPERQDVHFTYRTSAQYGTVRASEIGTGKFYVYQPFWAVLAQAGATTVPVNPEAWEEFDINDTVPWPGKEALTGSYVKLERESNVEPDTGIAKRRADQQQQGGVLTVGSFDEFEVVPHS